jgi:hypothetical protein
MPTKISELEMKLEMEAQHARLARLNRQLELKDIQYARMEQQMKWDRRSEFAVIARLRGQVHAQTTEAHQVRQASSQKIAMVTREKHKLAAKHRLADEKYIGQHRLTNALIAEVASQGYIPRALFFQRQAPSECYGRVQKIQSRCPQDVPLEGEDANLLRSRILKVLRLPSQLFSSTVSRFFDPVQQAVSWADIHSLFEISRPSSQKIFLLLAAGETHLTDSSFTPLIDAIIATQSRVRSVLVNRDQIQAYRTFVCVSVFFEWSARRCHRMTAQEFTKSNLQQEFLLMSEPLFGSEAFPVILDPQMFHQKRAEFYGLSGGKQVLAQQQVHSLCNPIVLANWLQRRAAKKRRGHRHAGVCGLALLWVSMALGSGKQRGAMADWFQCLDVDMDGRVGLDDIRNTLESKTRWLSQQAAHEAELHCQSYNMPVQEADRIINSTTEQLCVNEHALVLQLLDAIPELSRGGLSKLQAAPRSKKTTAIGLRLFRVLVSMDKNPTWDGYKLHILGEPAAHGRYHVSSGGSTSPIPPG